METGNSVGPNVDGELCVRGPIITKVSFCNELLQIDFTSTAISQLLDFPRGHNRRETVACELSVVGVV